jgi:hypothetical protein
MVPSDNYCVTRHRSRATIPESGPERSSEPMDAGIAADPGVVVPSIGRLTAHCGRSRDAGFSLYPFTGFDG